MFVSKPVFYSQVLFSSMYQVLSQAVVKVLQENGIPADTFSVGRHGDQYLEFSTYESVDEFCKAVCPHIDSYWVDNTFRGGLTTDADVQAARTELSVENLSHIGRECKATGNTYFVRRENYVEFVSPAKIRFFKTDVVETHIVVEGKTFTNTEKKRVYTDWYESLPYTCSMDVKPYFRVSISKN